MFCLSSFLFLVFLECCGRATCLSFEKVFISLKVFSLVWKVFYTRTKNIFNGGLFLHYPGLKPLLSSLPGVSISPAKPSLENVLVGVFTNPRKHQSITKGFYPLVFNIGFKTSVKFCGFKTPVNYHEI